MPPTGYDNAFNYYIKDVLAFPSSYNGFIKATTGTLGLIANFTLNLWLIRRFAPQNTLLVLFPCCAVSLLIAAQMKSVVPFLGACIVFYFFNSVYLPIQQTMMTQIKTENTGLLSGMFNAAKSLGNFVRPAFHELCLCQRNAAAFLLCLRRLCADHPCTAASSKGLGP